MEVDPGFRKRVPFLSSVDERKIMNHFVTAGQFWFKPYKQFKRFNPESFAGFLFTA